MRRALVTVFALLVVVPELGAAQTPPLTRAEYSRHTAGWVSLLEKGADPTGASDSTAAIQSALDAARVAGGGTVYIPRGTFLVKPGATTWLRIGSNVTLQGTGDGSVLKVASNAGNYPKLIGGWPDDATSISNVTLRDFRIDQNPTGNVSADVKPGTLAQSLYGIAFTLYSNVAISGLTIDPMMGVNGVSLNGGASSSGALVANSRFRFVQGHTTLAAGFYDHSAVYLNCSHGRVIGNRFEAASLADRAGAAFELHGGPGLTATGNTVLRYTFMSHVTTVSTGQPEVNASDITVSGNTGTDVGSGILLWPLTGKKLRNVAITGNVISINNVARSVAWPSGDGVTYFNGIGFNNGGAYDGAADGVTIAGNEIVFDAEATRGASYTASNIWGIGGSAQGAVSNLLVVNNTIRNVPSTGLKLYAVGGLTGATIAGNKVVNAGNDSTIAVSNYRSAIWLFGTHTDVHVENNHISDTNGTVAGAYSIYQGSAGTGVVVRGNTESTTAGAYARQLDASTTDDDGFGAHRYVVTALPPTKLSVMDGDEVVYRNGTSSAFLSVVGAGTWGTLGAVTGTTTNGQPSVTLSSVAGLARGDYISVAGGFAGARILSIAGNVATMSTNATGSVSGAAVAYVIPSVRHKSPVTVTLASSGAVTADTRLGTSFELPGIASTAAITINTPTFATVADAIGFHFVNTGATACGTITWASQFRRVGQTNNADATGGFTGPAAGKNSWIWFTWNGTYWFESGRTADMWN